jgi:hypothetical protein
VGSTMLMQLLGTSPEVTFDQEYPFEHRYLTYFLRFAERLRQPFDPARWNLDDLLADADDRIGPLPFVPEIVDRDQLAIATLAGLWSGFEQAIAKQAGRAIRFYAEKTWDGVDAVSSAGLNPVIVDLVRDPRDVVVSVRSFNAKRGTAGFGRAEAVDDEDHLRRMVESMRKRLEWMLAPVEADRILVRYEDLARDLDVEANRIGEFLGIHLDAGIARARRSEMAHHVTTESAEASVGRWHDELAHTDVAVIEEGLGEVMAAFGYEVLPAPSGVPPT